MLCTLGVFSSTTMCVPSTRVSTPSSAIAASGWVNSRFLYAASNHACAAILAPICGPIRCSIVSTFIERLRVDDPFLRKQCFQCLHAQRRPRFGGIVSIMVVILVVVVSAHRFLTALFFAFVVPLFFTTRTRPFFVEAADMRFIVGAGFFRR